jgi:NitT/TauT family transport system substrate-binding protein
MRKLVLETTAPFQGLPELVACNEGLFAKEGIEIEWADRDETSLKTVAKDAANPLGVDPFGSHGKLLEAGKADMYNACEWGNYCRVEDTKVGSRQLGRRAIVSYAGIVVRPESPVYTGQQLANRAVGVPFYAGTHYLALHLLSGFMPREAVRIVPAPSGSRSRLNAMMRGDVEAVTLTEPYLTLAEKKGCRAICAAFYHGTEVASNSVDAETYAAFNRAVRAAVRLINADKPKYVQYFIDYHGRKDPEIAALKASDINPNHIVVCDPAPIPADELKRTYDWIKSWGMLARTENETDLINMMVQQQAHQVAAE